MIPWLIDRLGSLIGNEISAESRTHDLVIYIYIHMYMYMYIYIYVYVYVYVYIVTKKPRVLPITKYYQYEQ